MARILVADYSRTGNTRKVAQAIASALKADIEEIRDPGGRHGLWGWLRSGREAWLGRKVEIAPVAQDPGEYDLVVLGSPLWAGNVSSPMRRYLHDHASQFSKVALFLTKGGSSGAKALGEMARLAGSAPVATLELTERELASNFEPKLAVFVEQIKQAV